MHATPALTPPISRNDHTLGDLDAPLQMLEFGDYQCPYCGAAQPVIQEIRRELGDRLLYAFRNFPLVQVHQYAEQAAEAAEAAGAQGKFWEMHDLLYQNQHALDYNHLVGYADQLGLDVEKFQQDLRDHAYRAKIASDYRSGEESGVPGTPTFFLNGIMYQGPIEPDAIIAAIRQAVS